ncbi:tryptophan synthase subunit alpha [Candidatus Uabimicrobium sp. HlEnr_7]|uniref:tryptophan synthase subunit alpha n=1 Tax=Candidatus Uabimicrobium helgolandensis TaxID=3095367 RepID=UPI0035572654
MRNRIIELFESKDKILSLFNTAGFPHLNDTLPICQMLQNAGVDMIELGFPFSDPIADGTTIQHSNQTALANGMSLRVLFEQLQELRSGVTIPVLLMGYLNPVLQFGIERFCEKCSQVGIDGVILPDLPFEEYCQKYKNIFRKHNLSNVFLITQRTSTERIRAIDNESNGFIYAVSTASVTGNNLQIASDHQSYFSRLRAMNLKNPFVVGFGISDKQTFDNIVSYANGAIIASAFIRELNNSLELSTTTTQFVNKIRGIQ